MPTEEEEEYKLIEHREEVLRESIAEQKGTEAQEFDGNRALTTKTHHLHQHHHHHFSAAGDGYCNVQTADVWCQAAALKA